MANFLLLSKNCGQIEELSLLGEGAGKILE